MRVGGTGRKRSRLKLRNGVVVQYAGHMEDDACAILGEIGVEAVLGHESITMLPGTDDVPRTRLR
jgi:hypothetical protein